MTQVPAEGNPISRRMPGVKLSSLSRKFRLPEFGWPRFSWIGAGFFVLVTIALGMRLWELGGRAMHYDEAIHLHYSWRLLNSDGIGGGFPWIFGKDFIHSPWMHGPFQIEFTAIIFRIFGDSDFTARLGYALFGAALAGLPYFLRDHIGRAGAILAGVMLAVSPAMLYFSRFGRNDILMGFWATALFILMWRYMHEGKSRYLYIAAVVLAFMFGTKETAYIVTLIFGAMAFLLALPQLVPWVLGRERLSGMAGPAGFFLLLVTLTLPQWVPIVSLAQDALGLTLANVDGVAGGLVGAPQWEDPSVLLPIWSAPWWLHMLAVAALAGGLAGLVRRRRVTVQTVAVGLVVPLLSVAAACLIAFRPIDDAWGFGGAIVLDLALAGALAGSAVGALFSTRTQWAKGVFLLIIPAQLALVYAFFLTGAVNVDSVVNGVLPNGISVDASVNAVPVNFIVAGGMLLAGLNVSLFLGVLWLGGRWLILAGIFYLAWITVYTTVFTNLAGAFSGVWQGMGYWIAQQDVARGNQPWYYYFVGLSIYEILPLAFGIAGAVYFLKKWDILGLALSFWAVLTLIAYTSASEKMPWLIVNITLPFILLSAKYLGHVIERIQWRVVLVKGQVVLLALPPVTIAAAAYLLYIYTDVASEFTASHWAVLVSTLLLAATTAYLVRLAKPRNGGALVALSIAGLLLAFGVVASVRAAYTFDDSNKELLVYAQGSKDVPQSFSTLDNQVLVQNPEGSAVTVDYDLWYPFNWYARDAQRQGSLNFSCFKEEGDDGWNDGCKPPDSEAGKQAFLLSAAHSGRDGEALAGFQQEGPLRNLLWFYEEAYRRPGENRQDEGSLWGRKGLPSKTQLTKDFRYFKSVVNSKESWFDTLDYLLFRNLSGDWYNSEYYSYFTTQDTDTAQ
ncbi:MAG: hypothetical protein BZY81_08975 [SAR202 cluster bacterium Io17-Chloro-G4]|nr:MAG: hypothetical protein BZY81_08975 [SAR202 cluster bacterium Io17-Chloro-G4]